MTIQAIPMADTLQRSYTAGSDLAAYLRVRLDANAELIVAGGTDASIGYLTERGGTAGLPAAVRCPHAPEQTGVASGVITVGGIVYAAALGKLAGSGTVALGQAITAAGADGDLIRFAPIDNV